jgi:hypothetical protein
MTVHVKRGRLVVIGCCAALADNMLADNPVASESLVQLMWGALTPGRERPRVCDPDRNSRCASLSLRHKR